MVELLVCRVSEENEKIKSSNNFRQNLAGPAHYAKPVGVKNFGRINLTKTENWVELS